ncbi:septal ring lytic transglycosylase RlpA family protein [Pampinifervens florentissimum]|uniref:septal ring lytic transglycosylase RlpA family protein n=1 Tax=Pampinifervens florentissimum TaxID=1632019 RepID=UPI0013B48B7D|nr:septal ring lytic transglycosylase RlpA family protein [Hydrogenobacter sp. T-8]QID33558.1 septal ring lytic transglycosylase RlpA family protein [Hydrogenobacter sp. T-8]
MKILLLVLLLLISSCSVVVQDRSTGMSGELRVNCPEVLWTEGFYCTGDRAYSNLVQSGSRVRVVNTATGKSITIAVFRREDIKGICVPERFKNILGDAPFPARLEIQRCGVDDRRTCPARIKGLASYYAEAYHGRETTYGIRYDMHGYYVASPDLPLGSLLRVKNLKNGREVVVKVIDRGPLKPGRVLDLSYSAARDLDMLKDGVVEVQALVLRCGE